MTTIPVVLINLANTIKDSTGKRVYILDDTPNVSDPDAVYIISPATSSIANSHMIGGQSIVDYAVHIYEVKHIMDSNRQVNAGTNVMDAYYGEQSLVYKIFTDRMNYKICTANVYEHYCGTTTWVVNSKVYTAYDITLRIKDILEQ